MFIESGSIHLVTIYLCELHQLKFVVLTKLFNVIDDSCSVLFRKNKHENI